MCADPSEHLCATAAGAWGPARHLRAIWRARTPESSAWVAVSGPASVSISGAMLSSRLARPAGADSSPSEPGTAPWIQKSGMKKSRSRIIRFLGFGTQAWRRILTETPALIGPQMNTSTQQVLADPLVAVPPVLVDVVREAACGHRRIRRRSLRSLRPRRTSRIENKRLTPFRTCC